MRPPSRKMQELQVEIWNLKNPPGTRVRVRMDSGEIRETTTRGQAYMLAGHTAVAAVDGISSCYLLSRIEPLPREAS